MAQQLMDNKFKSEWSKLRYSLRNNWDKLTEQDINQINGDYNTLIEKLKTRYGYSGEEAERVFEKWVVEIPEKSPREGSSTSQREESRSHEKETDNGSIWKWLLAILIPILAIAGYYWNQQNEAESIKTPTETTIITVQPVDGQLMENITSVLRSNPSLAPSYDNLLFQASNGVVTITGTVPSEQEKEFILTTVRNLAGVSQVVDKIEVK